MNSLILTLTISLVTFNVFAQSDWYTIDTHNWNRIKHSLPKVKPELSKNGIHILNLNQSEVLTLSQSIHKELHKCGGFKAHANLETAHEFVNRPSTFKKTYFNFQDYSLNQRAIVPSLLNQISEKDIRNTIIKLSNFRTRFHNSSHGLKSTLFIRDLWSSLTKHRSDVKIELIDHSGRFNKILQPTVVLTVEGSDPNEEIVILGGHADSMSYDSPEGDEESDDKHAPGADDNASGIASITEVIRVLMANNFKPNKSIQFMAYAAEEVGLVGSGDIAKKYKAAGKNVVGVMQLDMTLFKGTKDKDIVFMTDDTNKLQNNFLVTLVDEYVKVPWGYSTCGGCSDHVSWNDEGYVVSFPFESYQEDINLEIHTSNDTLDYVGGFADHAVNFTKLATAYVVELAD